MSTISTVGYGGHGQPQLHESITRPVPGGGERGRDSRGVEPQLDTFRYLDISTISMLGGRAAADHTA